MKVKLRHITPLLIVLVLCISIAFTAVLEKTEEVSAALITKKTMFNAGSIIMLKFKLNIPSETQLFVHSSYGSTVINPDTHQGSQFTIPSFIANKKGIVTYTLFYQSKILTQGEIQITSNETTQIYLESYIGPPSIIAGGKDYTMHVVVPTDAYDNPLPDSTAIVMKHQFLEIEKERIIYSKDMIGWTNIFSYNPSGRLLLFSKVNKKVSKEFSVDVFPALPENFQIRSKRKHMYADGNQITQFITSEIKDEYDNVISDGTLVDFVIKDTKGVMLHTQGSTINGQAIAKMLHPDKKETWEVKAYVQGMAESNTISITYTQVLEDFNVQFNNNNREIIIGPLQSFMEQLIPDGAMVRMDIFKEQKKIDTKIKTTSEGIVRFLLQEGFYPSGSYDIQIKALGVQKEYKKTILQ
ncbi:hypothetical protein [Aquimarina algiphila]|uniref:hypothetical protein n=1 Tax=Aquimarina algiphila TaxID=2047982 RepID=UPI00249344C9|nr:hypothetical protein [Aquimarina algiphila]